MKKITSYIKTMTDKCRAIDDEYRNEAQYGYFGNFLWERAERCYKNVKMLEFFEELNRSIIGVKKEEFVDFLENTKKRYVKVRLQNNPVNFTNNPMANLIRLWDFESYGEIIKEIDILLSKK